MRTAGQVVLGLVAGFFAGLVISEIIGIVGVLAFDRAVGFRYLPRHGVGGSGRRRPRPAAPLLGVSIAGRQAPVCAVRWSNVRVRVRVCPVLSGCRKGSSWRTR
jgi:hypothetical protein